MNLTYRACKSIINRRAYKGKDDMQFKLDIFLLNDRLNQEEYDELTGLMDAE